jgi:Niemann-Pick C1 protein
MCVDWIGYYMELLLSKGFEYWGLFVAYAWFVVLPLGLLICIGLSIGLVKFQVTTDPVQLWSAKGSDARMNKEYFDSHFNPFYRTEMIIFTPLNDSIYPHFSVLDPATQRSISKTMGPVFTKEVLNEVFEIQNYLTNDLRVPFQVNETGPPSYVTLSDICFKAVNEHCIIQSVLQYFQNNVSLLNYTRGDPLLGLYGNWLSHIDYCVSDPTSVNASDTYMPCLGLSGAPVDPNVALGGFPDSTGGSTPANYDNATALIVTFVVNNHLEESQNKMAEAWEQGYIDYLKGLKGHLNHTKITFLSERSIEDEITRESNSDIVTIAISYGFMFLYVIIFIGGFRSVWTIPIDRLYLTGIVGVLLVILAVTSAIGIMSYAGVVGSLIIIEVVPFLVLAVGVDNLFIIVHAYERCRKANPHMRVNKCISKALGSVAPSVTLTAVSESAAFLLGSVSPMPAVKTFSLYAGAAVFINFLLQISIFVSVLKLDMWIREALTKAACKDIEESETGLLKTVVQQYSRVLLHWSVRPFVMLLFGLTTILSISVAVSGFEVGLDQNLALPKDSYLIPYFDELYKYLHTGSPVYFVIEEGYNYSDPSKWHNICSSAGCSNNSFGLQIALAARDPDYSYIAEPAANWVDSYLAWINPSSACCGYVENAPELQFCELWNNTGNCIPCVNKTVFEYTAPTSEEFVKFLPLFKLSNPSVHCDQGGHAAFNTAIDMLDNDTTIGATYFMTYSTILRTSDEYVSSIRRIKELTSQLTKALNHNVFAYSVYFVFYEQYLTTGKLTIINLSASMGAVALMTFCLMRLSFGSTFVIVTTVLMVIVDMLALMILFSISLNAVSLVNLVMTVGIAVEFCSHIVRWFYKSSKPTKLSRAEDSLVHMGTSVISGITITKFLGVFILLFAKSRLFEVFYFRMYMCMILTGVSHGLVFLPVLLSYIGPTPRWIPKKKKSLGVTPPGNDQSNGVTVSSVPTATNSIYPTLPQDLGEKTPLIS